MVINIWGIIIYNYCTSLSAIWCVMEHWKTILIKAQCRGHAWQNFTLNDPFSCARNPGKILKFTSQTFYTSVAMTSHKHKQKVAHKFYKRKQNANINLYRSMWNSVMQYYTIINLVRVRYDGLSTRERLCHPRASTAGRYVAWLYQPHAIIV
jgi:hypothetical protein